MRRAVRPRPRPVQGGQRHPGPPDRRPAPAGGVRAAARGGASRGHGGPPRRRRVRRAPADRAATTRPPSRWPSASGSRWTRRSSSTACSWSRRASIGVALAPTHGNDVEQLLRCADIAMYVAKGERSVVETYSRRPRPSLAPAGSACWALCVGRSTTASSSCTTSPRCRSVAGRSPASRPWSAGVTRTRGLVLPDDFVPLAEQLGTHAQAHGARRRHRARPGRRVVGPAGCGSPSRSTSRPATCTAPRSPRRSPRAWSRHGLPAAAIRLELTERILMSEPARVADSLAELERVGVRLSLDDFGTGYSSLVLLQRLPVSEIKVDRSFVQRMASPARTSRSSARSSTWPTRSASTPSPRASRTTQPGTPCARSAATARRAGTSPGRCRPPR